MAAYWTTSRNPFEEGNCRVVVLKIPAFRFTIQ